MFSRNARKGLALCVVFFAFAGCVQTPKRFPIGLYDVPVDDFPKVAAAGFNVVIGPADKNTLDAARTNYLEIIVNGRPSQPALVQALDRHPALRAWYLIDEPDLHRVSPQRVKGLNRELRQHARKPSLVVLSSGAAAEKYWDTADILGVDWYPVPWAPVATVAREMRLARIARRDRPFYAVVQAFDWKIAPQLLSTDAPLRAPTPEEIRCMAYLGLMQGAFGIFFYTYKTAGWKLEERADIWPALSELALELGRNAPLFEERISWWPVQTQSHGPPAEMYNEIMEARVLLSLFRVSKSNGGARPGYYLIAVNSSATTADFSFELPFTGIFKLETSCGTNDFSVENGWIRKTYVPFEVCILGPIVGTLDQ